MHRKSLGKTIARGRISNRARVSFFRRCYHGTPFFFVLTVQLKPTRGISIFITVRLATDSRRRWPVMHNRRGWWWCMHAPILAESVLSRGVPSIDLDRHHATPVDARRLSISLTAHVTFFFFPCAARGISIGDTTSGDIIQVALNGRARLIDHHQRPAGRSSFKCQSLAMATFAPFSIRTLWQSKGRWLLSGLIARVRFTTYFN